MENQNIVIRAAGLSKCYESGEGAVPVLRGIDLTVRRGECVFLVGPSGSGKTTLLSIVGCILSADAGSLEILGMDACRFSAREQARFRREKLGFVFQRYHLIDSLTAAENVRVPLDLLGWPRHRARAMSLELLSRVGLEGKAGSRVNRLSMGQRQRVAIARALAGEPELILADEPTAALDSEAGWNAMQLIKNVCRDLGQTVVVVTHDCRIHPLADRILQLEDGRIVADPTALCAASVAA
jgi:putative ABC transport system ATP-binding protein